MNILFYDIVPTNIIRFFKDTVFEFDRTIECNMFFLFEHDDEKSINEVQSEYGKISNNISYCQFMSINTLKQYMKKNCIDVVFINGQRIADDRVVLAAKELNVKTYMLQHGMYIPFLKRDTSFFLKKVKKSISYLFYALNLSLHQKKFSLLIKYIMVYVFGRNQVKMKIDRSKFNVDKVFVYSKYWKDFHTNQFGYSESEQLIVGTPDLRNLNSFLDSLSDKSEVCYIAQTLVEDGRLERNIQEDFFSQLSKVTKQLGLKLIVKLHPRSDISLFPIENYDHISFVSNELPHSYYFIGHYSTLLAKPMVKSDVKTIIYEYEGHITPKYFAECASKIIKNKNELMDVFFENEGVAKSDIKEYFAIGDGYEEKIVNFVISN